MFHCDQAAPRLADSAPPTGVERRRFYSRTTHEALSEARQHQHTGAHPYRVVLGEVSSQRGTHTALLHAHHKGPYGFQVLRWQI